MTSEVLTSGSMYACIYVHVQLHAHINVNTSTHLAQILEEKMGESSFLTFVQISNSDLRDKNNSKKISCVKTALINTIKAHRNSQRPRQHAQKQMFQVL